MASIKILRLISGEEVLGEILNETRDNIIVKNPCLIGLMMAQDGRPNLNMQRMLTFSEDTEVSMNRNHILFMTSVDSKIENKYNEIFGNIIVAQPKIITS